MRPDDNDVETEFPDIGAPSFDATKLTAFLKQYTFDDLAKAFFALDLWLPNIASAIKFRYAYATLESICPQLQPEKNLQTYGDFKKFCEELFPLLPSLPSLEDFVPEGDWGEIKYFYEKNYYRILYGSELLNAYDFYYAFEILYRRLDRTFQTLLTGRSPLLDFQHCLEYQDHLLSSVSQDKPASDPQPGDLIVPSEDFWIRTVEFIDKFDPSASLCGSRFVKDYGRDCSTGSPPVEMHEFISGAFDGKNCSYLFLRLGKKTYPAMPRRAFCVVYDSWGVLLQNHFQEITSLLDDGDLQHHVMVELSRFTRMRWRGDDVFAPAAALYEDLRSHDMVLIAARSKNRLFVFHATPLTVTTASLEEYLKDLVPRIAECKTLLSRSPMRLALLGDRENIEFKSGREIEALTPVFIVAVPWCSTGLISFKIPPDLDATVMGMDQLCGLIDEVKTEEELSDFFDYLETLEAFHVPPSTTYLDKFGSFRGFNSVLVRGVRQPDFVMFNVSMGSNVRFQTLKDFWSDFPEGMFGNHPRSWRIPAERKTKNGVFLSSRELLAFAYFHRIGNASVSINSPFHLMSFDQGKIADSLTHSLSDACALYGTALEVLQFAQGENKVHAMLFPASLVKESANLKHLLHLVPTNATWNIDATRLGTDDYALRVVYDDRRVMDELRAVVDRSFQLRLLMDLVKEINRIFPGSRDAEIEGLLAQEKTKPARFVMVALAKEVSFPEAVRSAIPGIKELKLADRVIAHLAGDLQIRPGTYSSDAARQTLNLLISGLVSKIDESVAQFGLEECLPFLLGQVDALIADDARNKRRIRISLKHEVDYERDVRSSEDDGNFLRNYKNYRYLVEKFVQLRPFRRKALGFDSLKECLALIDRLWSMYPVSDFLQYSLYPGQMTIDDDFVVSTTPGTEADIGQMQLEYGKEQAQIRLGLIGKEDDVPEMPTPPEAYVDEIDAAWKEDFGFDFRSLVTMQKVMGLWAEYSKTPERVSYSASATDIANVCAVSIEGFDKTATEAILDFLTLKPEQILKVTAKDGETTATTLPVWEHSKRLSRYTIRPLIRIGDKYYWGPHSVERSARVWSGVARAYRLPADFAAPKVRAILERGHDDSAQCLADKIEGVARRYTSTVKAEVFPHKFDSSVEDIGDCDVLAFLQPQNILLNIESKIIDPAYCMKDVARIQRKIFGRVTSAGLPEPGYLQRVEARANYLRSNSCELMSKLAWAVPDEPPRIVSLFVTPTSYWWTMFPPLTTDVKFVQIKLLDDFIKRLVVSYP